MAARKGDLELWNVADEVRLKSGGPVMIVVKKFKYLRGGACCQWFNKRHRLEYGDFPKDALELVEDKV